MTNAQDELRQPDPRDAAIELAYGMLWSVPVDTRTQMGRQIYGARKALLAIIDKAGQSRGITASWEALRAAKLEPEARPAPDAGLIDREAVARIIDPVAWKNHDHWKSLGEPYGPALNASARQSLDTADAILALLSQRPAAGEPVAWIYEWKPIGINNPWAKSCNLEDPRIRGYREYRNVQPVYAHPAPEGRDPATAK